MKRIVTLFNVLLLSLVVWGQAVDRDKVILEIGTGTGCPYCPGAAMGAEDLIANGKQVGVIEYHNYNSSDPYNNTYAAARCSYYGISGYPTAIFDGASPYVVGGSNGSSLYSSYLPKYNQHIAIPSDFTIAITGEQDGQTINFDVTVNNVNNNSQNNLRLMIAVTESDIPYNWQGQDHLSFVERLMLPDANGTNLDFSGGNTIENSFSFTIGNDWVFENCQLVIFIQNHSTKEILQGTTKDFISFYDYNASLEAINAPNAVCGGEFTPKVKIKNSGSQTMTSADITYHVNEEAEQTFAWTGSLESEESELVELPSLTIDNMLSENTLYVTISNPNGNADMFEADNSLSTTFTESQDFNNPPMMRLYVKTDTHPEETTWELRDGAGNLMQSGGPYDQQMHLYFEDLDITDNGCYSFTIYDAGGDGLTASGSKYYITYGTQGQVFISNSDYGYGEETQFSVGMTGVEENFVQNSFAVYPNPVSQSSYVMYELGKEAQVQMKMYDSQGKEVLNIEPQRQNAGLHSVKIDGSHLPNGMYFIDMQVNEDHYKKKIVIMK